MGPLLEEEREDEIYGNKNFLNYEMEDEARFTESAYYSEKKPGPNAPNQTTSFAHSLIKSHVAETISTNVMQPPVFFNQYFGNEEEKEYENLIV